MLLSELPTSDPRVFGGVVLGDVEDTGCDVECPTVALALECWRASGGCLRTTRDLLHAARPGEPWGEWLASAVEGWAAVATWRPLLLAACMAAETSAAELRTMRRVEREVTRARAELAVAEETSVNAMRLLEEVLGA